jgi:transposase
MARQPWKRLTVAQKAVIVALSEVEIKPHAIAQTVKCHVDTVYRTLNKHHKGGPLNNSVQLGRPRKTTPEQDTFIVDTVDKNRKIVPRQVQKLLEEQYGVQLSLSKIRWRLQMAGLDGCVCSRKPLLTVKNKMKRLLWAYQHRNWTPEQWKRVLWSDEKKFELFNSKRRQTCRRRKGEQLRSDTIQPTVKHGGGSAMFWGCFGGNQVGDLVQIHGIMRKEQYHAILVHHAIPSGMRLFSNGNWVFQEDNDPKHTSNMCKNYFRNKIKQSNGNLEKMTWPPQSPDLSPIELLWEEADRAVLEKKPTSVPELVRVVHEAWDELEATTMDKLLARMPRICQAVIDSEGGYFDEKLGFYRAMKSKQMVYH